eukprot:2825220-Rhodomonas_salina.1
MRHDDNVDTGHDNVERVDDNVGWDEEEGGGPEQESEDWTRLQAILNSAKIEHLAYTLVHEVS